MTAKEIAMSFTEVSFTLVRLSPRIVVANASLKHFKLGLVLQSATYFRLLLREEVPVPLEMYLLFFSQCWIKSLK